MFKIERGSKYRKKYRKMDCFRKYSIGFFKIEKTQNRSIYWKQFFTFYQLLWVGQIYPKLSPL